MSAPSSDERTIGRGGDVSLVLTSGDEAGSSVIVRFFVRASFDR
jgi:hypothetical protein